MFLIYDAVVVDGTTYGPWEYVGECDSRGVAVAVAQERATELGVHCKVYLVAANNRWYIQSFAYPPNRRNPL